MESNMWSSRIRGNGCPRMKRVLRWSRLAFRCHKHKLTQIEREGDRERQSEKLQNSSNITSILKSRERMHGKCMNMWHTKEIALWAQPNPNLPTHNQLHTSKMHDNTVIMLMWCNAWDFMIKSLKPIPKFQQNSTNLKNPKIFPKNPKS